MNIFEALRVSHDTQRALAARLLASEPKGPERHAIFLELKRELKAHETALAPLGVTIEQAWTTFTRWNAHTGIYASANSGYLNAAMYPLAPREMPMLTSANAMTSMLTGISQSRLISTNTQK